jgi:formate C-acetyltransferase
MESFDTMTLQEQRLQDQIEGKADRFSKDHERASRILETFQGQRPHIDIERARYFTESMKQTEGRALILRWARAMQHVAENITVYVDDSQLLAGRCGCQGRYGILYPELDGDYLDVAVADLPTRAGSPFSITEEDARVVVEEISPYWKGKTFHEAFNASLPEDIRKLTFDNPEGTLHRYIVSDTASGWTSLQWVHDYEKVLKRGFNGIRAEALSKLEALDPMSPVDYVEKAPFLKAVIIVCDAIVIWARRHADLARKTAGEESDAKRRQELLDMAAVCEWVPANPARTFHEAVQAQYFTQMFSRLEQKTGAVISNAGLRGRGRRHPETGVLDQDLL